LLLPLVIAGTAVAAPYAASTVIPGLVFEWSTHRQLASGSDNWPITWADDDQQYTSWGDGNGFGPSRTSLGVARIAGISPESFTGSNTWTGSGKAYGIISVDGVFYMWVSPGSDAENYNEARLHRSTDHGATWSPANWALTKQDGLILPTFLQFGKDYAGARDNYVYTYANHFQGSSSFFLEVQKPGEISLLRVPKTEIMDRTKYEFYAGSDANGNPQWTKSLSQHKPVFQDTNGVGWCTGGALYNAGLKRYLLVTEYQATGAGNLAVFEASAPWGPWRTVYYGNIGRPTFFANFSQKWMSADGRDFVLVFTGVNDYDSWNTVRGSFSVTSSPDTSAPAPPVGLQAR
jgi:hypothetical protein